MESLYLLMQYKFASAARRGRAFMDLNGPWLVSVDGGTNAPDVHWDWNIQGMYYMPFLTNRPEIANSLVDYAENLLHSGVLWSSSNVQPGWEDSAAAPTGASGLDGQQSCYWNYGVNCTVSPPSVTGNLLWTLHVVHQSGIYQGNATVSTAVVWPLLCRALRFYGHFLVENTTHITLPPTFSPEYPGPPGPNANYDLALLRWGVRTAIRLTKQHKLPCLVTSHYGNELRKSSSGPVSIVTDGMQSTKAHHTRNLIGTFHTCCHSGHCVRSATSQIRLSTVGQLHLLISLSSEGRRVHP